MKTWIAVMIMVVVGLTQAKGQRPACVDVYAAATDATLPVALAGTAAQRDAGKSLFDAMDAAEGLVSRGDQAATGVLCSDAMLAKVGSFTAKVQAENVRRAEAERQAAVQRVLAAVNSALAVDQ